MMTHLQTTKTMLLESHIVFRESIENTTAPDGIDACICLEITPDFECPHMTIVYAFDAGTGQLISIEID